MFGRWYLVVLSAITSVLLANGTVLPALYFLVILAFFLVFTQMRKNKLLWVVCLIIGAFYFIYAGDTFSNNDSMLTGEETIFTGTVLETSYTVNGSQSFQLKLDNGERLQGFYNRADQDRIFSEFDLKSGDRCRIEGRIEKPDKTFHFYGFDYQAYLHQEGIHWVLNVEEGEQTFCRTAETGILNKLRRFRGDQIERIASLSTGEAPAMVSALVFGDRSFFDNEREEQYRVFGLIHLLAVSGLHVGLVTATLFFIFIRIGIYKQYAIVLLVTILPVYVMLAGGAPSVVRSSLMTAIVLVLSLIKVRLHPFDVISFVALAMLIADPYLVFHLGFQLSFFISFSLLASNNLLQSVHSKWKVMLLVTIIAQLVSLPIILYHQYEWSFFSLPLNLLFIPFISFFVLPISFLISLLLNISPTLAERFIHLLDLMLDGAHWLFDLVDRNFSALVFGKPSIGLVFLLIFAFLISLYVFEKYGWSKRALLSLLPFFLLLSWQKISPYFDGEGEVTMLDVGQGDAIYVELPYREAIYLIDTGGNANFFDDDHEQFNFEPGRDVVLPYLKAKGVTNVDRLILTHGHADHIGGVPSLVDHVGIERVHYPVGGIETDLEHDVLMMFRERGIPIKWTEKGDVWEDGDTTAYVVSPTGKEKSLNNRSIVFSVELGTNTWLFTGDVEEEGERRIVADYPGLDVDILKVAHHGSATSTTDVLLETFTPSYALISAGRNNLFGHPHDEVIDRLYEREIMVYRTDENGDVRYIFDRKNGKFEVVVQ
ncbi:DNA internalization-related competence protein ComEC/Rec2 [Texcoconibacillus texcoconensis]|uniref:Competence protein ComEC n=1 Tax=Texcoconibacillus texcoconensis TaxID=1095777 RepID=A0A840QRL1_9BACI|nr:DNA internalization-related competence protein ComEC/Rec2 [Texcoconibacillus texcoconensis]MBB5173963.1 competence protein ComEC [Texcoconibacillus texcoconensis]